VSPPAVLSYGAGTIDTTVTAPSGCAWTAATSESWISISSGASETASGIVTATLSANGGSSTRVGSITVAGKSFDIIQAASTCTYTLSGNASLPSSGGDLSIGVTTPTGCPWKATSNSPAVSVVSGSSGTGSGTVTLSVAPNDNVSWFNPTAQIGPQVLTIQEADICTYTLSPQTLSSGAASASMTVTANPAGCSWSPTSDSSWLTVSGSGTGSGDFPYSVVANTTGEPRTANVMLDHQLFAVTQEP
jgi:Putative binding domain, N-terminal